MNQRFVSISAKLKKGLKHEKKYKICTFYSFPGEAILLVNINGCGYPPKVTCSDFFNLYSKQDTIFPCVYSEQNSSIVVPRYEKGREQILLFWALFLPFGTLIGSICSLFTLTCKRNPCARRRRIKKRDPRRLRKKKIFFMHILC